MELNRNWNLSHEKKVRSPALRKTASRSPDFVLQKNKRVFHMAYMGATRELQDF